MNKKAEIKNQFNIILGVFVLIILGFVFIVSVANTKALQTTKQPIINETTDINAVGCLYPNGEVNESSANCNITFAKWTAYAEDWRTQDSQCYPSSVVVINASGSELTLDTDYELYASDGVLRMLNTTDTINSTNGNSILADYKYCDAGYLQSSGDRMLANLWTIMMILAILAGVILALYKIWDIKQ